MSDSAELSLPELWLAEIKHLQAVLAHLPEYEIEIDVAQDGQPPVRICLRSGQTVIQSD